MKRINFPIKWKLTIWYGGILALILIYFQAASIFISRTASEMSIDVKIKSIADVLASSMTEEHGGNVFGNFERYLENVLGKKPKGKFIQIIDSSG